MSLPSPTRHTACILADDLTGACDAAAAFAARGATCRVLLTPQPTDVPKDAPEDILALCTNTRDGTPEAARHTMNRLLADPFIARHAELFKKVDSVFRGNTAIEIAAAIHAAPGRLAILAPAYPALGRTTQDGHLHIHDLAGTRTVALRDSLHAAGLRPHWLAPAEDSVTLAQTLREARRPVVCDALTDAHLESIVDAARSLGRPVLWIGSAGLAHALAASLYPRPVRLPELPAGPLVLFTGSDHPVSQRQLEHFAGQGSDVTVLRVERFQTDASILRAAALIDSDEPVRTLLFNGGDTALHVCRALGIESLNILGEFAPGIPVGEVPAGPLAGTAVILKSGGFGAEDLLTRIAGLCAAREHQRT